MTYKREGLHRPPTPYYFEVDDDGDNKWCYICDRDGRWLANESDDFVAYKICKLLSDEQERRDAQSITHYILGFILGAVVACALGFAIFVVQGWTL